MNFQFERHASEESLELYALGTLDQAHAETLEEHILICEDCRVRLDEADKFVHAMQLGAARLRQDEREAARARPVGQHRWFQMPAVGWATAAVAALVVVAVRLPHPALPHPAPATKAVELALVAERGAALSAPAHRLLDLKMDLRGIALSDKARVEMVDAEGRPLETATAPDIDNRIEFRTTRDLSPGAYYLRVYAPGNGEMLREFSLDLK